MECVLQLEWISCPGGNGCSGLSLVCLAYQHQRGCWSSMSSSVPGQMAPRCSLHPLNTPCIHIASNGGAAEEISIGSHWLMLMPMLIDHSRISGSIKNLFSCFASPRLSGIHPSTSRRQIQFSNEDFSRTRKMKVPSEIRITQYAKNNF